MQIDLKEVFDWLLDNWATLTVVVSVFFEITPIKINPIKVERSRRLVSMAIEELIQSGAAPELSRQLCGLRSIEDVLWQLTTEERPRAMGGGS